METRVMETRGSETPHHLPPALLPAISYSEALRSRFTLGQKTYTIRTCPGEVFKRFIEQCGQEALGKQRWKPFQQADLLLLLDRDCSDVARWYAIDLLLAHNVSVPLERGKENGTSEQIKTKEREGRL